jgi:hypothetical protein
VSVIDRAQADLADGRLWRARDRLTGALVNRPHDQEVIDLLGEVYLRMGDTPAAGRTLMLSTRDDDDARQAREAFAWLHRGNSHNLAAAVPVKAPIDAYPPSVRTRLEELAVRVRADGFRDPWQPRQRFSRRTEKLVGFSVAAIAAILVLPWLVGAGFLIHTLVSRL